MTELTGELVGLPEGGPTSVPAAKTWLRLTDTDDDEQLELVVAAVNAQVRSWRCAQRAVGATEWPGGIALGATMLAARLYRRQNSPAGVEAFGSDGAVYVSRNDPDIGQLLQLGTHQLPTVG